MDLLSIAMLSGCVLVGPPDHVEWSFGLSSSGDDVSWTSPSSIRADGEHYEMTYTVKSALVMVSYIGIDFGPIDVTDMIPEEDLVKVNDTSGPCPLEFAWYSVLAPEGQDPPSLSFDWVIEINGKGFVTYRMENLFLGEAEYDLGWPWGVVVVQIESGTINSHIEVEIIEPPCTADIDGSGVVDVNDLLEAIGNWGECIDCPADLNQDGFVDVTDLLLIVGSWGPCV